MWTCWRTRNGSTRIKLAISRSIPYFFEDLRGGFIHQISNLLRFTGIHANMKHLGMKLGIVKAPENTIPQISDKSPIQQLATPVSKPIIFASYCIDASFQGNLKFCGGTKELNLLVKLLRQKGYEAYMVTYDGSYEPWLLDSQPHLSIAEYREKLKSAQNVRCVTSLAGAKAFIQPCQQIYLWDMELAITEHQDFAALANLYQNKLQGVAAISRTIQAWHMAHFQRSCTLLPNLIDRAFWFPTPEQRQPRRVGYMVEGSHTEAYLKIIREIVQAKGLDLEFQQIQGIEAEVLAGMRSCEVFLSMNIGKDLLWGEGCPRTVIETLATGGVVIAFDIIGNRETIQDNFNSILVPRYRPDLMAEALVRLYSIPGELDCLRSNALALMQACHTFEARWSAIKEFLQL